MRLREFIGLVGGATLAWSLGARAQEPGRVYRLALVLPVGRDEPASLAFLDELRSQGFVEGKNLVIVGGLPQAMSKPLQLCPLYFRPHRMPLRLEATSLRGRSKKRPSLYRSLS
jgi:hypothetical protein